MKKVLIISFRFLPYGTPGGCIRVLKFAKYLPHFSWQAVILSVKHGIPLEDEILLNQIRGKAKVYYTRDYLPRFLSKVNQELLSRRAEPGQVELSKESSGSEKSSYIYKVSRFFADFIPEFELVPDNTILWMGIACRQASRIIRDEKIDVLLTSAPTQSTHLIGLVLKTRYGIPWVAEFRDQWVGNPAYHKGGRIKRKIHSILEKKVVTNADAIVSVTEDGTRSLAYRYPNIRSRFETITNGFDAQDFDHGTACRSSRQKMTFVHLGRMSSARDPGSFLKALCEIRHTSEISDIEARFVGPFEHEQFYWKNQLQDMFVCRETVTHKEAIEEMLAADVLLIFQPKLAGSEFAVPGKLYEYIAARKPILGMVSEGPTKKLIEAGQFGVTVDYEDVPDIKRAILDFHSHWLHKNLGTRFGGSPIDAYSRRNLTHKLAQLLSILARR